MAYRYGFESRKHVADFFVFGDDGQGDDDLLYLIVEIEGYQCGDAQEKVVATKESYRIPGVNNHRQYNRWAFAEFTDVYQMESDFEAKVEAKFNTIIEQIAGKQG